jgi:hypothetical protein
MLRTLSVTLVVAFVLSPAFAKGKPASAGKPSKTDASSHGSDHQSHGKSDAHGDHGKASHSKSDDPAGWDKGKKTGWGDCDAPPGQEKKAGTDCENKKSGGVLSVFKRNKTKKKPEAKDTKKNTAKPVTTTKPPATAPKTTTKTPSKTTTSTTPTTTTKAGVSPGGRDTVEGAKKR